MHRDDLVRLREILGEAVPPVRVRASVPGYTAVPWAALWYSDPKLFCLLSVCNLVIKLGCVVPE